MLPSLPPVVIVHDGGGLIANYLQSAHELDVSGRKVVIDGWCASACTLFASVPRNACVTPRAQLWFHAAYIPMLFGRVRSEEGTQVMMANYPARLRQYIRQKGGLTTRWIKLKGRQLRAFFRPC